MSFAGGPLRGAGITADPLKDLRLVPDPVPRWEKCRPYSDEVDAAV